MERTLKILKSPLKAVRLMDVERVPAGPTQVAVWDPLPHPLGSFAIGKAAPETGAASVSFITEAVRLAGEGLIEAMVTAPINKEAMHMGGYRYPGHTELLADLTKSTDVGMMILGGPLKIMFTTTHVALRELPDKLTVPLSSRRSD
jgi:4-hydroxythreonine-4-phosphate dehydrogenase